MIVVAPDSFKGSVTAAGATRTLIEGWREVRPGDRLVALPMADGGEGTLAAFADAVPESSWMPLPVTGPDGAVVDAGWLLLPDGTAVVELACTSGIELLGERRLPWDAHTCGFGEAIAAALDSGAARLVLGIGSSASTDGGVGMLRALGAEFRDEFGDPVADGARGLAAIRSAELSGLPALPPGGVTVLTDVRNPLLGANGAAAVFGPQKGFGPADLESAAAGLAALAAVLPVDPDASGAGAAGGTGFALLAWGARLVPGSDAVAELIGLAAAIADADLVITGEGSYDAQSVAGKVPSLVAALAASAGVPVALVAGGIARGADLSPFSQAVSLVDLAGDPASARADALHWLREAAHSLAEDS